MLNEREKIFNKIKEHYYFEIEKSIESGNLVKKKEGKQLVYKTSRHIWTPSSCEQIEGRVDGRGKNALKLAENLANKVMNILYPNEKATIPSQITFGEVANEWLKKEMPLRQNKQKKKVISGATQNDYIYYGKRLSESNFWDKPINLITLEDINNYMLENWNGKTQTPYKYIKTIIVKTFSLAKHNGYINSIPFSNEKWDEYSRIKEPSFTDFKEKNIIPKDLLPIVSKASAHMLGGLMIPMLLYTGIRPSELIRLEWIDFDAKNNLIKIHKDRTKTKSGERKIPIPKWLTDELQKEQIKAKKYEKDNNSKCKNIFHVKFDYSKSFDSNSLRAFWRELLNEVDKMLGAIVYRGQIICSNFDYSNTNIIDSPYELRTHNVCKSIKNKENFDKYYPDIAKEFISKEIPYFSPDSTRHTFKSFGSVEMSDAVMRNLFGHTTGTADDTYEHIQIEDLRKQIDTLHSKYINLIEKPYFEEKQKMEEFITIFFNTYCNKNAYDLKKVKIEHFSVKAIYFKYKDFKYKLRINSITECENEIRISSVLFDDYNDYRKTSVFKSIIFLPKSKANDYKNFSIKEYKI